MLSRNLALLFFTYILSVCSLTDKIILQQTKDISLQVDQIFESSIPLFFDIYQSSEFVNFTLKDSPDLYQGQPICRIQEESDSEYVERNAFYHYKLADPKRYFLGLKKISSFSQLSELTGIIDAIQFNGKVVVLFQNGFYSFYSVDTNTGGLSLDFVRLLNNDSANINESSFGAQVWKKVINYGDLLYSQSNKDHLVFFGQDQVLVLNSSTMRFQEVSGYDPIGQSYEKAVLQGNQIYVASLQKGIAIYHINFESKQLTVQKQFKPYLVSNQQQFFLKVSDLTYDTINNKLIIIDQQQGIYWVRIPESSQQVKVQCQEYKILVQRCENLKYMQKEKVVVATCPLLLLIDLQKKTHRFVQQIQFSPQSIIANQSRLLIFGEYRYAVYDIETSLVETGERSHKIDFVVIVNQWIVIVNTISISTGVIHPDRQKIVCYTEAQNSSQLIGKHSALLTIEGICSQLYPNPLLPKNITENIFMPNSEDISTISSTKKEQQNCQLVYNINLEVVDSSIIHYIYEIIFGIVIVWILVGGTIAFCVRNIQIQKDYDKLNEEGASTEIEQKKPDGLQMSEFRIEEQSKQEIMKKQ